MTAAAAKGDSEVAVQVVISCGKDPSVEVATVIVENVIREAVREHAKVLRRDTDQITSRAATAAQTLTSPPERDQTPLDVVFRLPKESTETSSVASSSTNRGNSESCACTGVFASDAGQTAAIDEQTDARNLSQLSDNVPRAPSERSAQDVTCTDVVKYDATVGIVKNNCNDNVAESQLPPLTTGAVATPRLPHRSVPGGLVALRAAAWDKAYEEAKASAADLDQVVNIAPHTDVAFTTHVIDVIQPKRVTHAAAVASPIKRRESSGVATSAVTKDTHVQPVLGICGEESLVLPKHPLSMRSDSLATSTKSTAVQSATVESDDNAVTTVPVAALVHKIKAASERANISCASSSNQTGHPSSGNSNVAAMKNAISSENCVDTSIRKVKNLPTSSPTTAPLGKDRVAITRSASSSTSSTDEGNLKWWSSAPCWKSVLEHRRSQRATKSLQK